MFDKPLRVEDPATLEAFHPTEGGEEPEDWMAEVLEEWCAEQGIADFYPVTLENKDAVKAWVMDRSSIVDGERRFEANLDIHLWYDARELETQAASVQVPCFTTYSFDHFMSWIQGGEGFLLVSRIMDNLGEDPFDREKPRSDGGINLNGLSARSWWGWNLGMAVARVGEPFTADLLRETYVPLVSQCLLEHAIQVREERIVDARRRWEENLSKAIERGRVPANFADTEEGRASLEKALSRPDNWIEKERNRNPPRPDDLAAIWYCGLVERVDGDPHTLRFKDGVWQAMLYGSFNGNIYDADSWRINWVWKAQK